MTSEELENLADELRKALLLAPGDNVFGVVDGAQDMELAYEAKQFYGAEIRMLFKGQSAPPLAHVAPYIVSIDPEKDYLRHWVARLGFNAGILLTTPADMNTLFDHLRDIFLVKTEEGEKYYFRFYDPRVLRAFLPACNDEERGHFFGPVRCYLVEGEEAGALLRFAADKPKPQRQLLLRAGAA